MELGTGWSKTRTILRENGTKANVAHHGPPHTCPHGLFHGIRCARAFEGVIPILICIARGVNDSAKKALISSDCAAEEWMRLAREGSQVR